MNLFTLLNSRPKPISIGIIGARKFATMFFAQALKIPSIHIVGVVDLYPENAKSNMEMVGWDPSAFETSNLSNAFSTGKTFISDDWEALTSNESIEIIIECPIISSVSETIGRCSQSLAGISTNLGSCSSICSGQIHSLPSSKGES